MSLIREILPWPEWESAERYGERFAAGSEFRKKFEELEAACEKITGALSATLCEHAKGYLAIERDRATSIISRAQALLVSQTFFGILLTFGTAAMGHTITFHGWWLYTVATIVMYLVVQIILLSLNALRAISGLSYYRIGTSDLTKWVAEGDRTFEKRLALETLRSYRRATIANTWRIRHLEYAQACIRNIILSLGLLIAVVLLISFCPAGPTVGNVPADLFAGPLTIPGSVILTLPLTPAVTWKFPDE